MTRRRATRITTLIALLILIVLSLAFPKGLPTSLPGPTVAPGHYRVTQVYDGDTFAIDMNGHEEKVRLIGIDTPETHKPNTPVQCFGPEASAFVERTLSDQAVRLEVDPIGDNRDRYGRLLRYAYLPDGTLLNRTLIGEGYAFAYLSFQFQKQDEFAQVQAQAQATKKGLWAVCQPELKDSRWKSNDKG